MDYAPENKYTPFGVQEGILYIGKGENTVSIDLESEQEDSEKVIDVTQDYNGTLTVGGNDPFLAVRVKIPPAKTELVDTGKKDDQKKEVFKMVKVPVDVENVTVELLPLYFSIEQEDTNND